MSDDKLKDHKFNSDTYVKLPDFERLNVDNDKPSDKKLTAFELGDQVLDIFANIWRSGKKEENKKTRQEGRKKAKKKMGIK